MVSVCIATYNGEKYIQSQLESILSQLSSEDEIIISDDGSTDSTISVIQHINDERIVVLREKPIGSPTLNLERALSKAHGEIIFLSDQDDIWLPGKVVKMVNALNNVHLLFSDATLVDGDLNIMKASYHNKKENLNGFLKNFFFNNYMGAAMAFRREILYIALPFPSHIPMHDQWIGLLGDLYFKTGYLNDALILYRRHGGNASPGEISRYPVSKKILFRLSLFWFLLIRVIHIFLLSRKNKDEKIKQPSQ